MKMQVKEFAAMSGVSVRTLHHYDAIGLLKPGFVDADSGYRFYDEDSFLRMQEILFYRELGFPLREIRELLSANAYDRQQALQGQKQLLFLKMKKLENLIAAIEKAEKGESMMPMCDERELQQYKQEAREKWGETTAYAEYAARSGNHTPEKDRQLADEMEALFAEFFHCLSDGENPNSQRVQKLVKNLQTYITENFYLCTDEILAELGLTYERDSRFRTNLDKHGPGTAEFISHAIRIYCGEDAVSD